MYRIRPHTLYMYVKDPSGGQHNSTPKSAAVMGGSLALLLVPRSGPQEEYGKFLVNGQVGWVYWPDVREEIA